MKKIPSFFSSSLSFFTLIAIAVTFILVTIHIDNSQLLNLFENVVLTLLGAYVGARGVSIPKQEETTVNSKKTTVNKEDTIDNILWTK